jgi:alpha-L-fucosidase
MAVNRREVTQSHGRCVFRSCSLEVCKSPGAGGNFLPTRKSLEGYQIPEWYRDAKFGIWSHWGPQSAIEFGDWYARNMYIQGSDQYLYHAETYGHPSKVGYKDLVNNWKAAKWDPDHLMSLYKKAGAKYFVSMGVHHDNFDLWDSKVHALECREHGPEAGCCGHLAESGAEAGLALWSQRALMDQLQVVFAEPQADKTGPLAGVPYDGAIRSLPTSITMPIAHDSATSSIGTTTAFPTRGSGITLTA